MGAAIAAAPTDLPEPYEFLDLEHLGSITLNITSYELGTGIIHPTAITPRQVRLYMMQNSLAAPPVAGTPITIRIPVLRVHGQRIDKPSPLSYWDISSKRLQADLLPRLQTRAGGVLSVTITATGYKPTKVFSVEQGG
jgi:hypothetical protein